MMRARKCQEILASLGYVHMGRVAAHGHGMGALYLTDLSDQGWIAVKSFLPEVKAGGRPPIHSRREILNGIFYIVRIGGTYALSWGGHFSEIPPVIVCRISTQAS